MGHRDGTDARNSGHQNGRVCGEFSSDRVPTVWNTPDSRAAEEPPTNHWSVADNAGTDFGKFPKSIDIGNSRQRRDRRAADRHGCDPLLVNYQQRGRARATDRKRVEISHEISAPSETMTMMDAAKEIGRLFLLCSTRASHPQSRH